MPEECQGCWLRRGRESSCCQVCSQPSETRVISIPCICRTGRKNVWWLFLQVCCPGLLRRLWRAQQSSHSGLGEPEAASSPGASSPEARGCSCHRAGNGEWNERGEPEKQLLHYKSVKVPYCKGWSRRKSPMYKRHVRGTDWFPERDPTNCWSPNLLIPLLPCLAIENCLAFPVNFCSYH